jgi:hypothetical protein
MQQFNYLMQPENENPELAYETKVKLDFSNYLYKYFEHETGYITFDNINFTHHQSITQTKMEFDRAASADFALIVENYITNQRNFASKTKDEEHIKLSEPINPPKEFREKDVLKNGSIIKISLEHYVSFSLKPTTKINKTADMTVKLQAPLPPSSARMQ